MDTKHMLIATDYELDISKSGPDPLLNFLAAYLERAMWDYIGDDLVANNRNCSRNAKNWFLSSSIEPFSFLWVCDMLEIDPAIIKKRVFTKTLLHTGNRRISKALPR